MDAATQAALAQIDRALDAIEPNLEPTEVYNGSYKWKPNRNRTAHEASVMALATIERLAPPGSAYLADAKTSRRAVAWKATCSSRSSVYYTLCGPTTETD
jgi:hypothetical protein